PGRGRAIVFGSIFAWRWSLQMQAVNMGDQFSFSRPSSQIEAQHFVRTFGGSALDPQTDQQTRDEGRIHLDADAVHPLTQQMPTTQDTFDPTEKQLYRPPIAIRQGDQLRVQVQPI